MGNDVSKEFEEVSRDKGVAVVEDKMDSSLNDRATMDRSKQEGSMVGQMMGLAKTNTKIATSQKEFPGKLEYSENEELLKDKLE